MNRFYLLFFGLLLIPVVSANILVNPVNNNLEVFKGQNSVFSFQIQNNNSFRIENVSFTPISYFNFPSISSLDPGEARTVVFAVRTDSVFDTLFVSTISYLYSIEYNLTPVTYVVNITSSGFVPNNLSVMQNDSVLWRNLLDNDSDVKDLGSGFSSFTVPVGGSVLQSYFGISQFIFYEFPLGFTGNLNIVSRSSSVLAHDSSLDTPVTFMVHSRLNPSTLQLNLLTFNFTTNNNQTQSGVLEVKNAENVPLYNVVLNDSRGWIYFSLNNFTLNPLSNLLITFNFTPIVFRTVDTNVTLVDSVRAVSVNGGNASSDILVNVNYQNFDTVSINGTSYSINFLSVNDTIAFCVQFPTLDKCPLLAQMCLDNGVCKNETVIHEIPAQVTLTENDLKAGIKSISDNNLGFSRVENLYNKEFDSLSLLISETRNNTVKELDRDNRQISFEARMNESLRRVKVWSWTFGIAVSVLILIRLISGLLELGKEFDLKVKALQE